MIVIHLCINAQSLLTIHQCFSTIRFLQYFQEQGDSVQVCVCPQSGPWNIRPRLACSMETSLVICSRDTGRQGGGSRCYQTQSSSPQNQPNCSGHGTRSRALGKRRLRGRSLEEKEDQEGQEEDRGGDRLLEEWWELELNLGSELLEQLLSLSLPVADVLIVAAASPPTAAAVVV